MPTDVQAWRRAMVVQFPWVRALRKQVDCEGVIASRVSRNRPRGSAGTMCARKAGWHFDALPSSWASSGNYCMTHLMVYGLDHDEGERQRVDRYMARHPEKFTPSPRSTPVPDVKDDDLVLDLSKDEDMAVVLALVPEWAELSEGLELRTDEGAAEYRKRLQAALDEAVAALAAEARVLNTLPPPEQPVALLRED